MSRIIRDLKIDLDDELAEKLAWMNPGMKGFHILRESIDARGRGKPRLIYSVEVFDENEPITRPEVQVEPIRYRGEPVLIVGSGPAGLFAALRLAERGIPVELFEQGSQAEERLKAINRFWRYGSFDSRNNVGFGEGGAGLYSDGKLITRIKSEHIPYVMQRLVDCGAPEEILYLSNPHVGSDRIRRVIPVFRRKLQNLGVKIHFDTKVTELITNGKVITGLKTEKGMVVRGAGVVLACGHSAEDIFSHLAKLGVLMEGKDFAIGLRIEHPQKWLNQLQYRDYAEHPKLGAANYKLASHDPKTNIGVYSFCMCPGGYVLSSGTDLKGVVSNGMSNYRRNSPFANAAIVVSVKYKERFGTDLFAGLEFRQALEANALKLVQKAGGTKELPVQRVLDFIKGQAGAALPSSCPSGVVAAPLHELLPQDLRASLIRGLEHFHRDMRSFITEEAQFHGIESRTSCPLRITRDESSLQSLTHPGLYPCGEGAGYAGGITSAACDGVRVAEAFVHQAASQTLASTTP